MITLYSNKDTSLLNRDEMSFIDNFISFSSFIPSDISYFSSIRQEKILKCLPWKYLPSETDFVVWADNPSSINENELKKLVESFSNDYDIFILDKRKEISTFGNLNIKSQLEKYSRDDFFDTQFFHDTSLIGYNLRSQHFKEFSLRWINEVLKESLNDEISFTYLIDHSNISVKHIQLEIKIPSLPQANKTDCFFKIVIPNYNNGGKLSECIESILNQSFKDLKIVICDDCSTDNSIDIAKEYSNNYPETIFLVQSETNAYSGHARNLGINFRKFTSQYTWFVDGDDKLYDNSVLKNLYEKCSITNADIVSFNCIYRKNGISTIKEFSIPDFSNTEQAISQFGIAPWHRVIKTDKVVHFFENCIRRQDLATVFRQYANCSKYAHLDKVCYLYNSRDYASLWEPIWSLQQVWLELKRQINSEEIPEAIQNVIDAYIKKYPKVFSKFEDTHIEDQIVIAMASYPLRKDGMMKVLNQLLPQCDYFCLYLNEYKEVPEEIAAFPDDWKKKLTIEINNRNLKDYGKFYWFGKFPGYYLTVDDDLDYSDDYCSKLVSSLKSKSNNSVVGLHGNDFTIIDDSFVAKKTCHPFNGYEEFDVPVDCLGTGAACFYPKNLDSNFRTNLLKHYDLDDLDITVSILAKSEGKMLYRISSEKDYIKANGHNLINPLANIHFAWEKRYIQYDLWIKTKKEKTSKCVVMSAPSKLVDVEMLDKLNDLKKYFTSSENADFYFIPIEERTLWNDQHDLYFTKFEFVKKFIEQYDIVSIASFDDVEMQFDFTKENYQDLLRRIQAIKDKHLKRINDKILKANLLKT